MMYSFHNFFLINKTNLFVRNSLQSFVEIFANCSFKIEKLEFSYKQNCAMKKNGWRKGKGDKKKMKDRTALEESPERLDILSACSHLFN